MLDWGKTSTVNLDKCQAIIFKGEDEMEIERKDTASVFHGVATCTLNNHESKAPDPAYVWDLNGTLVHGKPAEIVMAVVAMELDVGATRTSTL